MRPLPGRAAGPETYLSVAVTNLGDQPATLTLLIQERCYAKEWASAQGAITRTQ
jgi:hypothetical protein